MSVELPLLLVLAGVTVVAAFVHSALGFGSGPLLVPVLLLMVEPAVAVPAAVLVGMLVNLLQVGLERGRAPVPARRLRTLWTAGLLGCLAGALLAQEISGTVIAALVAAMLILSAAGLLLSPSTSVALPPAGFAAAGAAIGAVAALTGIFGPPLGALLVAGGMRGDQLRAALGSSFLVIGTGVLATSAIIEPAWEALPVAAALALPAGIGYLAGRRSAGRLDPAAQRRAVLAAVIAGAGLALARAAAG